LRTFQKTRIEPNAQHRKPARIIRASDRTSTRISGLTPQLHAILERAIARVPKARFASCGAPAEALTAAVQGIMLLPETRIEETLTPLTPLPIMVPAQGEAGLVVRDASWFFGLCGATLASLRAGEACPACGSTRALRRPDLSPGKAATDFTR
jgi:hypothetical protein